MHPPNAAPAFDAIIIGGGPAGSTAACLLAQAGRRALVLERDIHPREHVGESLTPSTNFIFKQIGVLDQIEEAGFVHKPGVGWTAATTPVGKYLDIRLNEFPPPSAFQCYSYNVERDALDALLLRRAHDLGAKVVQGAAVRKVLFEGDRAVGVRARVTDGWEADLSAPFVVDASGRACLLASQLGLKERDPKFNQLSMYSWFRNVAPAPPGGEGLVMLHFLGMERAWIWQIPLRNGLWSVGLVTDRADFKRPEEDADAYFQSLVDRNLNLAHGLKHAERIRPWKVEGDYTYRVTRLTGPGWLVIGDALRFVDPIFSTGVDVAMYSARFAAEAIDAVLAGREDEAAALAGFEHRANDGVEAWYDLIRMFYQLQNLFTYFAARKAYREDVIRVLQGNVYQPEALARVCKLIGHMGALYEQVMANPNHILRPMALLPEGLRSRPGERSVLSQQGTKGP